MTDYNPTDLLVLSDLLHEVCDSIYYTDLDFALVTRDEEKAKELTLLCDRIFNEACDLYLNYEEAVNPLIEDYDNLIASNANKKALMRKHRKGNALHKSTDRQHGKNWYKRNNVRYYEDIHSYFREIPNIIIMYGLRSIGTEKHSVIDRMRHTKTAFLNINNITTF